MLIKFIEILKNKFKHPLFRNSVFGSSGFVFISLIGLIITPLLVASFGLERYGIYILVTSIFGYYGIFDFGLGQGLIKFVAEYYSNDSFSEMNDAINSVFFVQLIIGLILTGLLFVFSGQIVDLLRVSSIYYSESILTLKIASIGFLFSMLSATYSSAMRGLELFGSVTIVDSLTNLALNVLLLIVLGMSSGIKEAVYVNVFIAVVQLIAYVILFKKNYNRYQFKIKFKFVIIKKFLSFTFFIFLSRISSVFATYVVRFVISFFLGPIAVTYYVVPAKLLGAFSGLLYSAANAILPYTSRLATMGKNEEIKNAYIKSSLLFVSVCTPILIVVILFSKPIMSLWMGTDFADQSWRILSIITLSGMLGSFSMIPNLVLLGIGNSRLLGLFSGITIVSYIIFLPIFTKYFGLVGAANSLLITSLIVIGFVVVKTTKAIGMEFAEYFSKVYKVHISPIIIIILSAIGYKIFLKYNSFTELLLGLSFCLLYYLYLFGKNIYVLKRTS